MLGVLFTAAVLACSDSTSPESIEGVYTLQAIDGAALPVVLQDDEDGKVEITAGAITLGPGTKWSIGFTVRMTFEADVLTETVTLDGTWSRAGSTLTLISTDGDRETVVLSGRTLTLHGDAGSAGVTTWVFKK